MENPNKTLVVTFDNHYSCILFKSRLKASCLIRPVPRALSSSCTACVFVYDVDYQDFKDVLPSTWEGIFLKQGDGYRSLYDNHKAN